MTLSLFPAIDISDQKAVRLVQGELNKSSEYGSPIDIAHEFVEIYHKYKTKHSSTRQFWVHLVDLDAAFERGENSQIIEKTVAVFQENNIYVESSGGIRNTKRLEYALKIGASRVNIGTSAIDNPKWTAEIIEKYADKIAIGLDVRGETLAARGWVKEGGNIWEVAQRLASDGASRFVVTDVNKDGTLQGPNLELLTEMSERINIKITASGGVSSLDDIKTIKTLSESLQETNHNNGIIDSVIFGKALYNKNFTLEEALDIAS